jgi:hypothetical protein
MFDYRYHAISLAAVLLALALGVLIGVAIGDSNLVSSAKSGVVRNLQSDLASAQAQIATARHEQQVEQTTATDLSQIAVHNILAGGKIGLVFLGSPSEQINSLVREAVEQAGGQVEVVLTIREPLDLHSLAHAASGTPYTSLASEPNLVKRFGFRIGAQLIQGGQLLTHEQTPLFTSLNGQFGGLKGVVISRSDPQGMNPEQSGALRQFQEGLIQGVSTHGAQTVGVELSYVEPSQIPWYKSQNISSVDDLDKLAGRAALDLSLAGARGAWGLKSSADDLLPRLSTTQP